MAQPVHNNVGDAFLPTLPNLLRAAAKSYGDREFLVLGDCHLTFKEADRVSADWAKGLLALGIGKASRVGLLMAGSEA